MRLAISNIAWDVQEDVAVAKLLQRFKVDAIDIAPGKYFPQPDQAREADMLKVRTWWADQGIEITGMQSLLFGTTGLNVFGDDSSQAAMLEHLRAVCRIGGALGASRLVFGSPKNRDRSGLNDDQALDQAVAFFSRLAKIAQDAGVIVCLEPNPTRYGANFMTHSSETAQVVKAVGHEAIRMQFDTGALAINQESPHDILARHAPLIGHVHASEPDLVPLGDGTTDHRIMHDALEQYLPHHLVSIEMVATTNEPPLSAIERALTRAVDCYCADQGAIG